MIATGNLLIGSKGIRSIGTSQPSKDIRAGLLYEMADGKRPDKWTRHLLNLCSFIPGESHCNFAIARGVCHRPIAIVG